MKKIALVFLAFLAFSAQAKKVKFAVDMTGWVVNATGMHVMGDFQVAAGYPLDWSPNSTPLNLEDSTTNIYSIVVDIPAYQKYEYVFLNGDQSYDVEFVPVQSRVGYNFVDNRWLYVDSLANDTTFVGAILFAGNAPAGLALLRTKVNMSEVSVDTSGVHLFADFQNWNSESVYMYSFEAGIYEVISYVLPGTYSYLYLNGNSSLTQETVPVECQVNSYRSIQVLADTVLDPVCFSSCSNCLGTSVSDLSAENAFLYPNPASGSFFFRNNLAKEPETLVLLNATGKILASYIYSPGQEMEISLSELSAGLYFVKTPTSSQRLIVQ